jgi:mRNA interferase MazF
MCSGILNQSTRLIKQFEIWIADLNPQIGTESGKTRPVLVVQTNLLNKLPHPSTIICPITTKIKPDADILRVHLKKGEANLTQDSDIMIDQIRAIDNKRLISKLGTLPVRLTEQVKENIMIVLDLD